MACRAQPSPRGRAADREVLSVVVGTPADAIADDRHGEAAGHQCVHRAPCPQVEARDPHADEEERQSGQRRVDAREQQVREQQSRVSQMRERAPPRVVGHDPRLREVVERVDRTHAPVTVTAIASTSHQVFGRRTTSNPMMR